MSFVVKQKESFESLILEFKEKRENVLSILKIILDQKKVEEFKTLLIERKIENQIEMREFIKSKYHEFIDSMNTMNECKTLISLSEETLKQLEWSIQDFLDEFGQNFVKKINQKEELNNLKQEKQILKSAYIMFAYLSKASKALQEHKLESSIQLIKIVEEKFLNGFSIHSAVYKRGFQLVNTIKDDVNRYIESLVSQWQSTLIIEQRSLGVSIFEKVKVENERKEKKSQLMGKAQGPEKFGGIPGIGNDEKKGNANIKNSMAFIKNTSNLNFLMNKSSYIKNSIMKQADSQEEFDLITMVSNININHLESCFNLFKKIDINSKCVENFLAHRLTLVKQIVSFEKPYETKIQQYEDVLKETLGFIIVQLAFFEIIPTVYTKKRFDNIMFLVIQELGNNINVRSY